MGKKNAMNIIINKPIHQILPYLEPIDVEFEIVNEKFNQILRQYGEYTENRGIIIDIEI